MTDKELRDLSGGYTAGGHIHVGYKLAQAADTIEALSKKLAAVIGKMSGRYYESDIFEKIISDLDRRIRQQLKIIPMLNDEVYVYGFSKSLEAYQQAKLMIEISLAEYKENRPVAYDTDRWIPCVHMLPEEKINPVTKDFCEYQVTYQSQDVTDVRHYKFGGGHWWNDGEVMDEYVTAWKAPIKPYNSMPEGAERNAR